MLGFSLSKLLVLAAVVLAVWYGWRWVARVRRLGARREDRALPVHDTECCPRCGAYVVAGAASSCGRPGCPYGA